MTADHELKAAKAAILALEDAYQAVFAAAHVGMTADQIDAIIEQRLASHGARLPDKRATNTPFVVDQAGVEPKLRMDRVPLERDKLWAMDTSVTLDGYWADLGRYAWFGSLPKETADAHQALLDRQDAIARAIRPGVGMDVIFKSIPDGPGFEVHRIGHEAHQLPFCGNVVPSVTKQMDQSVRDGLMFEEDQVICIELWAGLAGGIEDMYQVASDGVVRLSSLPCGIREIAI